MGCPVKGLNFAARSPSELPYVTAAVGVLYCASFSKELLRIFWLSRQGVQCSKHSAYGRQQPWMDRQ